MTVRRPDLGGQTWDEISTQPESWERAVVQAQTELPGYPAHGERVLIMGCGTSYYASIAWAWIREQAGHGLTDAVIASEFTTLTRDYDRVIAISRSGTSVDVVEALDRLDPVMRLTAVLGDLDTPIGARANDIIDLSYADETSVVQTRFPTTLLTLVRARHGDGDLGALIEQGRTSVASGADEEMPRQLVVLGEGYAAALAQEAALKCRESAGMWAEAYATGEYRHGPISVAGPGTLVWGVTPIPPVVVEAVEATGAKVRQPTHEALAELVTLQFHAVAWADSVGRDANLPIHLSRSVMTI
jgi:fructoselysine-6-P-deglycase FrlB-like protein